MPNTLIVGNWKMNLGISESCALAQELAPICVGLRKTDVWVAPSVLSLPYLPELFRNTPVQLGAQNVHWDTKGPFTGEISAAQIQEVGGSFSLVGHSERRMLCDESVELCARRALGALRAGLKIIFCIGETREARAAGSTERVLTAQLQPFLAEVPPSSRGLIVIAYEPVWAIGTGLVATEAEISQSHALIRALCLKYLGSDETPILYGGSVSPTNFEDIMRCEAVHGVLVGGASLSSAKFSEIIRLSEA
ncbi:MAG: triose-phosphate isomerase [Proteobacteria bacterium]|nr:triose-phosphate isomerase [Pseudomonadota bacterium]